MRKRSCLSRIFRKNCVGGGHSTNLPAELVLKRPQTQQDNDAKSTQLHTSFVGGQLGTWGGGEGYGIRVTQPPR